MSLILNELKIANKLVTTTGGAIGIGINPNASAKLHVSGDSANGTDNAAIWITDSNASGGTHYISRRATGLNFAEQGVADGVLFLKEGGNVGIGTTDPQYKLDIYGDARLGNNGRRLWLYDDGNAHIHAIAGPLWLNSQTDAVYINNQYTGNVILTNGVGRVGIYTSSPKSALDVAGFTRTSDITLAPTGSSPSNAVPSNTPRIYFSSSLGTSSINLEVLSDGSISFMGKTAGSIFDLSDNANGSLMSVSDMSGLPILEVSSDDKIVMGGYNTSALIVSGSQVGIGKYPTGSGHVLDVSGSTAITGSLRVTAQITPSAGNSATNGIQFPSDPSGGSGDAAYIRYYSRSAESMTLEIGISNDADDHIAFMPSGNVGIGTNSPSVKFHNVGSSILANNTGINPFTYTNTIVAGAIGDGNWGVVSAIGGCGTTGHGWGIGTNNQRLYLAYGDGASNNTLQSYIEVDTSRNMYLVPTSGNVGVGKTTANSKFDVNGNAIISGSLNIRGTASSISIVPNYAGSGDIPVGTLLSVNNVTDNNFSIIPSNGGTVGSKVVAAAYNGTAWRSMWEFGNVSTGEPSLLLAKTAGSVAVGKSTPNAKLDVNGDAIITGSLTVTGGTFGINGIIGFGSKSYTVTNSYTTGLTINLTQHTGIFIRVTLHGDLTNNSAIAYMGEYFIQNGNDTFAEPGIIIREVNNTNNGSAVFSCQIVDPSGTGTRNFEMQFKQNSATASVGATLIYQIQGNYNSVS